MSNCAWKNKGPGLAIGKFSIFICVVIFSIYVGCKALMQVRMFQ